MNQAGSRAAGAALILVTLANAVGVPVLAATSVCETSVGSFSVHYNCITQSVGVETIEPAYDNGLMGALDPENYTAPWTTWPTRWNATNESLVDGVTFSPTQEVAVRLYGAGNLTATENTTTRPTYVGPDGAIDQSPDPAVRVLAYHVTFQPKDVASGMSEWYYRSALVWRSDAYVAHYLNVLDLTGRVVASARYDSQVSQSGNVTNAELDNGRIYYRISAPLHSSVPYTFTEWVVRANSQRSLGMASVDAYVAANQDMDGDGLKEVVAFPGELAQHTMTGEFDAAYGVRMIYGMGPGGSFNAVQADTRDNRSNVILRSGPIRLLNDSTYSNAFHVEVPLRTTVPLQVQLTLTVCDRYATFLANHNMDNCGAGNTGFGKIVYLDNVTGTISETILKNQLAQPISQAGSADLSQAQRNTSPNVQYYASVKLVISNFNETRDANGTNYAQFSYPVYEDVLPTGVTSSHVVQRCDALTCNVTEPSQWAMWAVVTADTVPVEGSPGAPPPCPSSVLRYGASVGNDCPGQSRSDHSLQSLLPCQSNFVIFGADLGNGAMWCVGIGIALIAAAVIAPEVVVPLVLYYGGAIDTALAAGTIAAGAGSVLGLFVVEGGVVGALAHPADFRAASDNVWNFLKGATLATLCAGALVAPALGAGIGGIIGARAGGLGAARAGDAGLAIGRGVQAGAAVGCGLLALEEGGLLADFFKLLTKIPQILKSSVDLVGHLLSQLMQVVLALWSAFGPWIFLALYFLTAMTVLVMFRETILVAFSWLILLFLAIGNAHAVSTLQTGEHYGKMVPIPMWDNYMKRKGAIRGTYYRTETLGNPQRV